MNSAEERNRAAKCSPLTCAQDVLWRLGDNRHLIHMRGHHLVADKNAILNQLQDWVRLYTDVVEGREPAYPRREVVRRALEADATYLMSPWRERDRAFWRDQFTGVPSPPYLTWPTGQISPRTHHNSGHVPRATSMALRHARERLFTMLSAIIGTELMVYLARRSGQRHVQFAPPVAARAVAALRKTPLPMSNVFPNWAQLSRETDLPEKLRMRRWSILGALLLRRYRYEDIRADLAAAGTPVPTTPGVAGPVLHLTLIRPIRFAQATGTTQIISTGPIENISLTVYPRAVTDGTFDTQVDLDASLNRGGDANRRPARLSFRIVTRNG